MRAPIPGDQNAINGERAALSVRHDNDRTAGMEERGLKKHVPDVFHGTIVLSQNGKVRGAQSIDEVCGGAAEQSTR